MSNHWAVRFYRYSLLTVSFFAASSLLNGQGTVSYDAGTTYQLPSDPRVLEKISQWQELKFGLFMHWGTYSQWGIVESWTLCPEDRPFTQRKGPASGTWAGYKKAYENLQTTFNPIKFNPEKWAHAARNAGMKYVVFTTKHHDGFAMYDTRYSDYKITSPHTPFSTNPKKDIAGEIFNAFRKEQFMTGAYFSKPDWHSEDYWWSYFPPKDRNESYDREKYPDRWKRFTDYTYNQIRELVTGYGKMDLLWFDGNWANMDMTDIVTMARKNQPGIIIVDRHGKPEYVNYLTPEQKIPDRYIPYPWETCMTMGNSWSYVPGDKYKTSRRLIQILVDIVAKNGNLLLNIGPGPDGEWDPVAYERLEEISKWMQVNGESIYATKPVSPYRDQKWAYTGKERTLYASYIPEEGEVLPASLRIPVAAPGNRSRVALLGGGTLKAVKKENGFEIAIPASMRSKLAGSPVWVFKIS